MGWDLISWSFAVVRQNKRLLWFPILSAEVLVAGMCLLWLRIHQSHHLHLLDYLWFAPAVLLIDFATIFLNSALAACANAYFSGDEPTLVYGLRRASGRLVPIFVWSMIATTVGLAFNAIESRLSLGGKLSRWVVGLSWGMATYLVIPVLIVEDRNAFGSVRRSAQLLGETWGDQIAAQIKFGWWGVLLFVPCFVLGVAAANDYPFLMPIAAACFVLASATIGAAVGIFRVALYRYAAFNEISPGCFPEMLSILRPPTRRTRILDI